MKKLLAVMAVSVFALSACGGGAPQSSTAPSGTSTSAPATTTTSPADKTANLVEFLVEKGCATAKYDGNIPDAEDTALNAKYGFSGESDIGKAFKAAVADKASIEDKAVPKIEAKCKGNFTKAGVDPKGFLDAVFDEYVK